MYQLTEKLEQMIKLFDHAIHNNLFFKFRPLPNPNPNSHIKEYQKLTLTMAEVTFIGKGKLKDNLNRAESTTFNKLKNRKNVIMKKATLL